jgi:hypothetical protein
MHLSLSLLHHGKLNVSIQVTKKNTSGENFPLLSGQRMWLESEGV